jgi:hypothetical protein
MCAHRRGVSWMPVAKPRDADVGHSRRMDVRLPGTRAVSGRSRDLVSRYARRVSDVAS